MTMRKLAGKLRLSLTPEKIPEQKEAPSDTAENDIRKLMELIEILARKRSHADLMNPETYKSIRALSILVNILHEALPDPESGETASFPAWKKERILDEWLIQCRLADVPKPLALVNPSVIKGKKNEESLADWMKNFFGAGQVREMQELEKTHPYYFDNDINSRQAKTETIGALKTCAAEGPLHFLEIISHAVLADGGKDEKFEGMKIPEERVKNFVKMIQGYMNDPENATLNLSRSLNAWPSDIVTERFPGLTRSFQDTMEKMLDSYASVQNINELDEDERKYFMRQLETEIINLWGEFLDRMFYLILDEVFDPETGKVREEVTALLKQIQENFPPDSQGKAFALDEKNMEKIAYGLAMTFCTNIVFVDLLGAGINPRLITEENAALSGYIYAAGSKVLNAYNGMLESVMQRALDKPLSSRNAENIDLFDAKMAEWKRMRGGLVSPEPSPSSSAPSPQI